MKKNIKNKSKINKKGQGTLEYLLIVGGAILIAVIVVSLLVGTSTSSKKTTEEHAASLITMSDSVIPAVLNSVSCTGTTCDVSFQSYGNGINELVIDDDLENRKKIEDNKATIDNPLPVGPHTIYVLTTLYGGSALSNPYTLIITEEDTTPPTPGKVATPTATPGEGTYYSAKNVTLSTSTDGATIWYTLNGSNPICNISTPYNYPITISETKTLKAIACKEGWTPSEVLSEDYTIHTHIELSFNPAPGITGEEFVEITTTPDATDIWYTTDGSNPTRDTATRYDESERIRIEDKFTRIKAIAYFENKIDSGVQNAGYTRKGYVAQPIAEPVDGLISLDTEIVLSTTTPDAEIFYTTDETKPDERSIPYRNPILIDKDYITENCKESCVITTIAYYKDDTSEINEFRFDISDKKVETPTADPEGGNFEGKIEVSLIHNDDAKIYYTLDESTPTERKGILYEGKPITITETTTLKAIAVIKATSSGVLTLEFERILP